MSDLRFNCPHCQQPLEASPELLGMAVDCPACNGRIQLPKHPPAPAPEAVPEPEPAPSPPPPDPLRALHHLKRLKTRYHRRLAAGMILTCFGCGTGIGTIALFFLNPVQGYTVKQQQSAAVLGFCGGVLLLAGGIALLRAAKAATLLLLAEQDRLAKEGPPLPW